MVMLAFCPGTAHRETIANIISVVTAQTATLAQSIEIVRATIVPGGQKFVSEVREKL